MCGSVFILSTFQESTTVYSGGPLVQICGKDLKFSVCIATMFYQLGSCGNSHLYTVLPL